LTKIGTNQLPRTSQKGLWEPLAIASLALLAISLVFGGASREHALRLALVELAALPLLVLGAEWLLREDRWRSRIGALGLLGAVCAIPLIQLVPLPAFFWENLPGRDQLVLALGLGGLEPGWGRISMTPDLTWGAALALIPPAAMLVGTLSLSDRQRERLVVFCIAATVLSIFLGAAQLASGGSRLYPWATTAAGTVSGFFANRNHLATYLLVALPFAIVLGAASMRRRGRQMTPLWLAALFVGLVVIGIAAIRSRAGLALFAPTLVASLIAAWIAAGRGRPRRSFLVLVGSAGAALTAVAILALPPILARFDTQANAETRFDRWPLVAEVAQTYLPLGSGIGSFDGIYRSVEPLEQLDRTFFNQAHNDYLEVWLETGWTGIALIIAFLVWYGRRCWTAWRAEASQHSDLQRAASIGIGVILLHSAVDYPLRTITISVLLALCCGLLEAGGRGNEHPPRRVPN